MSLLKENQKYNDLFFITLKIINGLPVFINDNYFEIILDNINFYRKNKSWNVYAYTILINHIHLVIKILPGNNLSDAVKNFKSFTAKQILKQMRKDNRYDMLKEMEMAARNTKKQDFKVWRIDIWPVSLVSQKFILQKIKYTDLNAEKHKIVKDIEKYQYTSHHNHYCSHKQIIEIDDMMELL